MVEAGGWKSSRTGDAGELQFSDNDSIKGMNSSTHDKQIKMPASIIVFLAVAGISLITPLPIKASTVECSELAKRFSNGDVDFDEKLKCKAGKIELTYGKYCPRTQGIVCSKGRGWD